MTEKITKTLLDEHEGVNNSFKKRSDLQVKHFYIEEDLQCKVQRCQHEQL